MVHQSIIEARLSKLGVKISHWFKPELNELSNILMDDEEIIAAVPGRYFSGFALLVATNLRLLLIDKRTFFMTVEDTRYDMISEISYSSRVYDATIHIFTLNKQHNFSSIRYKSQLRELTNFVQERVWKLRQYQEGQQTAEPLQQQLQPMYTQQTPSSPMVVHNPSVFHLPTPHLPKHIGSAAMNGSRRYSPNVFASNLMEHRRLSQLYDRAG